MSPPAASGAAFSILDDKGQVSTLCGYCNSSAGDTSVSHGVWARSLTVEDYQALLDRGWRRSGHFLYTTSNAVTCCPAFAVRLRASEYTPSREHRRMQRRLAAFCAGRVELREGQHTTLAVEQPSGDTHATEAPVTPEGAPPGGVDTAALHDALLTAVRRCMGTGVLPQGLELPDVRVATPPRHLAARLAPGTVGTSAVAHALAASVRRLAVTTAGQLAPGSGGDDAARLAETLAHMMMATGGDMPSGVRVEAADNGHLNFILAGAASAAAPVPAPHSDAVMAPGSPPEADARPPRFCKYRARKQQRRRELEVARGAEQASPSPVPAAPLPATAPDSTLQLVVRTHPSCFDPLEFELYCRYQHAVHGDDECELTDASFTRFLVASPLVPVPPGPGTPSCGYGTFHRQYWLGDTLVAVGVVDVLPNSVSSVYLFYDPDYASLSLGKATACEEIAWVAGEQAKHSPQLQFYHLGLYIPTCPKMSYKAAFKPSQLLCPRTMRWVPLCEVDVARLDGRTPLVHPDTEQDQGGSQAPAADVDACLLLFPSVGVFRFADARAALSPVASELLRNRLASWAERVGPDVARRAACVCYA